MKDQMHSFLTQLKQRYVASLSDIESCAVGFHHDDCTMPYGLSQVSVLADGQVFARAGIALSSVSGEKLPEAATKRHPELSGMPFEARGLSLIVHPLNPFVPTAHMNLRWFGVNMPCGKTTWWFGGGMDLTPYYGFMDDGMLWHQSIATVFERHGRQDYPLFKQACDAYFYLPHRKEHRGIGGIFFDDFSTGDFAADFAWIKDLGSCFIDSYCAIVARRKNHAYTQHHQDFQHYRRGRYVEFNLLYDRGTQFGLQFGGRTEAILMSLPPHARWSYGMPEQFVTDMHQWQHVCTPRDWCDVQQGVQAEAEPV